MKKQFLLLLPAIFAGNMLVFGQAVPFTPPQPLVGCDDDPLSPIAGKSYEYSATADPDGGHYTFWATQDENFITTAGGVTTFNNVPPTLLEVAPDELMATSANYNVAGADNSVDITWSSGLLANVNGTDNPLFVAVHYNAVPNINQCSDNFKVYQILPMNGFTVDILSLDPITFLPTGADPYAYEPEQCPDIVRGATWAVAGMTYDYGADTMYFEFVAANFTDYWIPTFTLSGLQGDQAAAYAYTYTTPDNWDGTETWTALASGATQIETDETSTSGGVSVFVRVIIDNNTWENLDNSALVMTLDGQNAEGQWDVVNADCSDPGAPDGDDESQQVLSERPELIPAAGATWE